MPRENHCGECCCLKGNIEERACQLALYIIENKATVRSAAQRFGISKSTVHRKIAPFSLSNTGSAFSFSFMVAFWLPNREFMSRLASPVRVTLFGSSRPIWLVRFVRTIWASATPGKPISFEKLLCFASDWLISCSVMVYWVSWLQPTSRPLTINAAANKNLFMVVIDMKSASIS